MISLSLNESLQKVMQHKIGEWYEGQAKRLIEDQDFRYDWLPVYILADFVREEKGIKEKQLYITVDVLDITCALIGHKENTDIRIKWYYKAKPLEITLHLSELSEIADLDLATKHEKIAEMLKANCPESDASKITGNLIRFVFCMARNFEAPCLKHPVTMPKNCSVVDLLAVRKLQGI